MGKIEDLVAAYTRFVRLPWERNLAGPQKCWFVVYDPRDERRLRSRLTLFELATREARHSWTLCDLTDAFAEWMVKEEYRDSYFASPDDLDLILGDFRRATGDRVRDVLCAAGSDEDSVVAVLGVASLFGFLKVSAMVEDVAPAIRGRLLVFFPGEHEGNNYRLLDARDGWNYLAVPIMMEKGG
jgi:hypothetical protein